MFDGFFENLRGMSRLVTPSLCVLALVLFSLAPHAARRFNHGRPILVNVSLAHARSFGTRWTGAAERVITNWAQQGVRQGREQRRTWVARFNSFEVRIERNSRNAFASWSVTLLVDDDEGENDFARNGREENCI